MLSLLFTSAAVVYVTAISVYYCIPIAYELSNLSAN